MADSVLTAAGKLRGQGLHLCASEFLAMVRACSIASLQDTGIQPDAQPNSTTGPCSSNPANGCKRAARGHVQGGSVRVKSNLDWPHHSQVFRGLQALLYLVYLVCQCVRHHVIYRGGSGVPGDPLALSS